MTREPAIRVPRGDIVGVEVERALELLLATDRSAIVVIKTYADRGMRLGQSWFELESFWCRLLALGKARWDACRCKRAGAVGCRQPSVQRSILRILLTSLAEVRKGKIDCLGYPDRANSGPLGRIVRFGLTLRRIPGEERIFSRICSATACATSSSRARTSFRSRSKSS